MHVHNFGRCLIMCIYVSIDVFLKLRLYSLFYKGDTSGMTSGCLFGSYVLYSDSPGRWVLARNVD